MSSAAIAFAMFGCVAAGAVLAMVLARRLPAHHLASESRDVIKLGLGTIGTLTALVLGLLVAAAKDTHDTQSGTVKELAAQLAVLDRILARYGPEAGEARARLRSLTHAVREQVWATDSAGPLDFSGGPSRAAGEALYDSIAALEPKTDSQKMLKSRAQDLTVGLSHLRQRIVIGSERSIPAPLLLLLGAWQAALFAGYGLLAPRNATAIGILIVCMLSVACGLYLILELDRPFDGLIRVSDAPLRSVLAHLGE